MKRLKHYNEFITEKLNILKGPSEDETISVFNSLTTFEEKINFVKKLNEPLENWISEEEIINYIGDVNPDELLLKSVEINYLKGVKKALELAAKPNNDVFELVTNDLIIKFLVDRLKELYPIEKFFLELTKDLTRKEDREKYPDSIFWFKDKLFVFEYNEKNKYFYCSYDNYWEIFEEKFKFNYNTIKYLTKVLVEEHFNLKGITPWTMWLKK